MSHKFKKGDIVECLENYNGRLTKGAQYVVQRVAGELIYVTANDGAESAWYATRFKLAPTENPVDLHIVGEIVGRGNGVVSVQTPAGVVVIPEALAPVDPRLLKLREIATIVTEGFSVRAKRIQKGEFDDKLIHFVESIKL